MALVKVNWFNAETTLYAKSDIEEVTGATSYGLNAEFTGGPSRGIVTLQGSIDGVTWVNLLGLNTTINPYPHIVWTTGQPVQYIRLSLDDLSGGTSPTATASVIAV